MPELEHDIEIYPEDLGLGLSGDTVKVEIVGKNGPRKKGRVIKVEKRLKTKFVGVVEVSQKGKVVRADNKRVHVFFELLEDVPIQSKVYFSLGKWENPNRSPEGKLIRVLGKKGDNDVEMESILLERGFDATFEEEVIKEAENVRELSRNEVEAEIKNRKDFRDRLTFTIDPEDAKDFDDALSFKKLGENFFEIGIHIADVSHYLKEGTLLDKEARKRGVSIYLVDRTVPMLPESLSTDLCSLNPNEDKFTFSAVFEIEKSGVIRKSWFGKTVINSNKRFTYEEAQGVLDNGGGPHLEELRTLNEIAKNLNKKRFEDGAISFEQDEVKFELDQSGAPIRIFRKVRGDTHKLVEEFMLLANREVATHVTKLHKNKDVEPLFVYRIHDYPDPEKIVELGIFIKAVGYELKIDKGQVSAKDLNALFKQIEGEAEEGVIKTAAIRSMAKAIYSTKNIGHYGLGFEYYTHFTSPIRRYADVMVHRLLLSYLSGKKVGDKTYSLYENISRSVTESEIRAAEAERDSIKLKQVEYMKERIGKEFGGVISGVTDWGIYIEENETKCEGLVRISNLGNEYFVLDRKNYRLVGEKTKKTYSLGDRLRFKVTSSDLERKTLDYAIVG